MQEAACVSPGGPAGFDGATGPTGNSRGHGIRVTAPGPPSSLIRVTAPAQMFRVRVGHVLVASRSMRNWRLGRAPRNGFDGPCPWRSRAGPGRYALDTSTWRRKQPRRPRPPRTRAAKSAVEPGARRCGRVRALSHREGASESPAAPGAADCTRTRFGRHELASVSESRRARCVGPRRSRARAGPGRVGPRHGTALRLAKHGRGPLSKIETDGAAVDPVPGRARAMVMVIITMVVMIVRVMIIGRDQLSRQFRAANDARTHGAAGGPGSGRGRRVPPVCRPLARRQPA